MAATLPFYRQSPEDALQTLHSRKEGLSDGEVAEIKQRVGSNAIPKPKVSFYRKYVKPAFNLMIVILLIASILEILLGYTFTGYSVLVIITANIAIAMIQQFKAEKTLEALEKISSFKANVIRNNLITTIEASELVPGDILTLRQGDYIAADARLIEANELSIDESVLTGESVPVEKQLTAIKEEQRQIQLQTNTLFSSTFVAAGNAKAVVIATGINTEIGKISKGIAQMEQREIPLQHQMSKLAKTLGLLVIGIAALLFIIRLSANAINSIENTSEVMLTQISWLVNLAVAAIPFNFPILTTIILLTGVLHLARKQAIIRKLDAVETLGRMSVICTDKTGTLTQNQMTVQKIFYNLKTIEVTGLGYDPVGELKLENSTFQPSKDPQFGELLRIGILDSDSVLIEDKAQLRKGSKKVFRVAGNPTEGALLTLAKKSNLDIEGERTKYKLLKEFSFNSQRKRMSKIMDLNGVRTCYTKGAPERILEISKSIILDGQIKQITPEIKDRIIKQIDEANKAGLRTLALAEKQGVDAPVEKVSAEEYEKELVFYGFVAMYDPPRDGVKEAVEVCKEAGIKVVMITGDHPTTALSIAKNLGIAAENDIVTEGKQIPSMNSDQLVQTSVFARVAPEDKQIIIKAFQEKKHVVGMTGDGVNDALALENADVGIAMGIAGTDVAKNASDLILTDDSFATIKTAVYHGRGLFNNIRANIVFLLVLNLLELTVLTVINLAFNGAQIYVSNQLTILYITIHFFPPFGLMFDKYDPNLMKEPPKKPDEPVLSKNHMKIILIQVIALAGLLIILWSVVSYTGFNLWNEANNYNPHVTMFEDKTGYYFPINGEKEAWHSLTDIDLATKLQLKARTMCFVTMYLAEAWVALEARSEKRSMFKLKANWALFILLTFSLLCLILITNWGVAMAYMALIQLSAGDVIVCFVLSFTPILVMELYKKI